MSPRWHLAVLQIVLMCLDHVRLEDNITPRYFTDSLRECGWLSMEMLTVGTFFDLVTWRSIVLEWLGVRPWSRIQWRIRLTSCWSRRTSCGELISLYSRMSSVYRTSLAPEERGKSENEFIKTINRRGPKMEPWIYNTYTTVAMIYCRWTCPRPRAAP